MQAYGTVVRPPNTFREDARPAYSAAVSFTRRIALLCRRQHHRPWSKQFLCEISMMSGVQQVWQYSAQPLEQHGRTLRPSHLETATGVVGSPGNGHPSPQWPHTPETAMWVGGGWGNLNPGLGSHTPTSGLAAVTRNIAAWCVRGDAE
jgi:hypothetical protein